MEKAKYLTIIFIIIMLFPLAWSISNATTRNALGNGNTLGNTISNTIGNTVNNTINNVVGNTTSNTIGNTINTIGNTVDTGNTSNPYTNTADETVADKKIPQTGESIVVILGTAVLAGLGFVLYLKNKQYKEIN